MARSYAAQKPGHHAGMPASGENASWMPSATPCSAKPPTMIHGDTRSPMALMATMSVANTDSITSAVDVPPITANNTSYVAIVISTVG